MPDRDVIHVLVRHMNWANGAMLAACAPLVPAELEREVLGTYGSLGRTLVHLARAQGGYTRRLTDWRPRQSDHLAENGPFPGVAVIDQHLAMTGRMLDEAITDLDLHRRIAVRGDGGRYEVRAWVILLQATTHATEHRQQVATTLTALGVAPPEPDLWAYWRNVLDR